MNVATFNNRFLVPLATTCDAATLAKWAASPLFEHEILFERADEIYREATEGAEWVTPEVPYPMFRASFKVKYPANPDKAYPMEMFVRYEQGEGFEIMVHVPASRQEILSLSKRHEAETIMFHMRSSSGKVSLGLWSQANHEWLDANNPDLIVMQNRDAEAGIEPADKVGKGVMINQAVTVIVAFIKDAMAPSSHVAAVHPAKNGKSVEWVKARTHYTLIHHGHPANRATVSAGDRVAADAEQELTRMAHSRRAHYKTLTHERYRFARGKRIFVRATWVGPKEWKDEGGHQIYKILDPIE